MYSDSFFFFFSSRRRHTRLQGDWSSDVCSSDLPRIAVLAVALRRHAGCSQVAAQHQEDLHGHARIFIEPVDEVRRGRMGDIGHGDRKSTRLNSSHLVISYAVFCLKKKKRDHHAHPLSLPRRHDSDSRVGSSTLRHYTERRVTL